MERAAGSDNEGLSIETAEHAPESASQRSSPSRRRSISMHEGIAVWCDCCSCEAEPYWVEIAETMGLELGSDYEDPERDADPRP